MAVALVKVALVENKFVKFAVSAVNKLEILNVVEVALVRVALVAVKFVNIAVNACKIFEKNPFVEVELVKVAFVAFKLSVFVVEELEVEALIVCTLIFVAFNCVIDVVANVDVDENIG